MGCAKTGSGKTAAFVLPVLQMLSEDPFGIFCLVLTPTRLIIVTQVAFTHIPWEHKKSFSWYKIQ